MIYLTAECLEPRFLIFHIKAFLSSAQLSQDPRLFFLLIAFERTVMVVFERATSSLTLFDSHMHGQSDGKQ